MAPRKDPDESTALSEAVESLTSAVDQLRTQQYERPPPVPTPANFAGKRAEYRKWRAAVTLWLAEFPALTSQQRARRVGGLLKGEAQDVFYTLLDTHGIDGLTQEVLLAELDALFTNHNEAHVAREQWDALQQGDLSVVEFASQVRRIAATPGLEDIRNSEASLIHRFRNRLRPALQDKLLLKEFATLEDCLKAAVAAEQALARRKAAPAAVSAMGNRQPGRQHHRNAWQDRAKPSPRPPPEQQRSGRGHRDGHDRRNRDRGIALTQI